MPEYLAPGVYVEETSFRSKSIEGVSTTTTGFIGPTRYGPFDLEPDVITSLGEFERVYGDRQQLIYNDKATHNYVWHAARGFFEEGGRRLYVMRTFTPNGNSGKARGVLPRQPVQVVFAGQFIDQAIANAILALDVATAAPDSPVRTAAIAAATKARDEAITAKTANQTIRVAQTNQNFAIASVTEANAALQAATVAAAQSRLGLVAAISELARLQAEGGATPDDVMKARIAQATSAKAAAQKAKDLAAENQIQARDVLKKAAEIATEVLKGAKTLAADAATLATSSQAGSDEAKAAEAESNKANKAFADIPVMADADTDEVASTKTKMTVAKMSDGVAAATAATQYATSAASKAVIALGGAGGDPLPASTDITRQVTVGARFPGRVGNSFTVRFKLTVGKNVLTTTRTPTGETNTLKSIAYQDAVLVIKAGNALVSVAVRVLDAANQPTWEFQSEAGPTQLAGLNADTDQVLPLRLLLGLTGSDGSEQVWDGLALDPNHPDAITVRFPEKPASLAQARTLPIVVSVGSHLVRGWDIYKALFSQTDLNLTAAAVLEQLLTLEGGNDGQLPEHDAYAGTADPTTTIKTGLKAFEDIEDISIVAAPGCTANYVANSARANTINGLLIAHAERMRYMIAVLDSGEAQSISEVRALKARLDSKYAALYYPWVKVLDPVTREEIALPPSGFVSGIYARNDINRAVWKAPANEVVNSALSFELLLNKSQQDVLNPEGINCFRYFEGRGLRLWGARTTSSDPEWKYVSLRRYFAYLERSIDRGTQWAVFEPNGDALWANVRRTIEDFLFNEWNMGGLLGEKPERAYFVKCDRTTMTQNDLDNGRLVCLIGVAPVRPAEFVIFRIGQWTGDRRV